MRVKFSKINSLNQNKIIIFSAISVILLMVLVPMDADAMYMNCREDVDLEKFPICNYVEKWNAAQEFGALVNTEVRLRVDEILKEDYYSPSSVNQAKILQIYPEARDKINAENIVVDENGKYITLEKWCSDMQDWIYEQIR